MDLDDPDNALNSPSVVATENASSLSGSPVASGAFYAARSVAHIKSAGGGYKVVVSLIEAYPVPGRLWSSCYNVDFLEWSPWASVAPD